MQCTKTKFTVNFLSNIISFGALSSQFKQPILGELYSLQSYETPALDEQASTLLHRNEKLQYDDQLWRGSFKRVTPYIFLV